MTLLHRSPARTERSVPRAVAAPYEEPRRAGPAVGVAVVSRAAVLLAVGVGLVLPSWVLHHQTWVLAGGFLLGLPHGAVDHLVPLRHGWVRRGPRGLAAVLVGYLAVAVLAYFALVVAGPVVLPVLLLVSVLHFGLADLETSATTECDRRPVVRLVVAALGRGAPVLAGPLLAWWGPTVSALAAVGLRTAPGRGTGILVAGVLLLASALVVVEALAHRRPGDALEVVLLVALFVVVPPLAAFGVYFGLWHGLRHTARVVADDPRSTADLAVGRLARPLLRFLGAAAAPTVVALAAVVALLGVAHVHAGLAPTVFSALLALTVPHVVVVGLWDHQRRRQPAPGSRTGAALSA